MCMQKTMLKLALGFAMLTELLFVFPAFAQVPADARAEAKRFWDSSLVRCGDTYYAKRVSSFKVAFGTYNNDTVIRLQQPSFDVVPNKLTPADVAQMNAMADKAAAKGSKQSLFMMNDVAMVVSIKNRTVITAVDQDSMKDNVFTNIDSAAIIK